MTFYIITIFPEIFEGFLKYGIISRAIKQKKIKIKFINLRQFTIDRHQTVDNRPFGGGPGMVFILEPILKAVNLIKQNLKFKKNKKIKVIIFEASGKKFDNKKAQNLAKNYTDLIFICGRYEGIDARLKKVLKDFNLDVLEISIGDYVLTGGEVPAMVLIDSISRQIQGVLHKKESLEEERLGVGVPTYTRPEVFKYRKKIYKVPKILLSGHQAKIEQWKKAHRKINS